MKELFKRMVGAARFDADTYELVEHDRKSNLGAFVVVLLASIAAAVGSGAKEFVEISGVVILMFATWMVWVGLTYVIGTRLLPDTQTHADLGEVLRTTGFSASPGVLRVLGLIPALAVPVFVAITVWMLLTFVVAIRQALDYTSSARALAACLLGWLIHGIVFFGFVLIAV
jgi:hypothetical protein